MHFYETISTEGSLAHQLTHAHAAIDFSGCSADVKHLQDEATYFHLYLHSEWNSKEGSGGKGKEKVQLHIVINCGSNSISLYSADSLWFN